MEQIPPDGFLGLQMIVFLVLLFGAMFLFTKLLRFLGRVLDRNLERWYVKISMLGSQKPVINKYKKNANKKRNGRKI